MPQLSSGLLTAGIGTVLVAFSCKTDDTLPRDGRSCERSCERSREMKAIAVVHPEEAPDASRSDDPHPEGRERRVR